MAINKVVINDDTIIDLSTDTVTAAEVRNGKTFHLPNGTAGVGTKVITTVSPDLLTATKTLSSNSRTLTFTVTKEPSWYIAVLNSTSSTITRPSGYFTGGTGYYFTSTSSSSNVSESNYTGSSSYSSGILTLTSYDSTSYYFKKGTYTLYYY